MPNAGLIISRMLITEEALGVRNSINLEFATTHKFLPWTLVVYLGGSILTSVKDFDVLPNHQGFLIKLSDASERLKTPPCSDEDIVVQYIRS